MSSTQNNDTQIPTWLKVELFEDILKQTIDGYRRVRDFKVKPAVAAGENYATIMLRIEIEVELLDGKTKSVSYMIKITHDNDVLNEMLKKYNMFNIEVDMYLKIVPEFEQMYRDVGVEVKFCANCYKLNVPHNHVLLEDLRVRGFKNTNRREGLDEEHTKNVLRKLAQWHAASAIRVQTKGQYDEIYIKGFFVESSRPMMEHMNNALWKSFKHCLTKYDGHEVYAETLAKFHQQLTDALFKAGQMDPNEFNVLNHGDCWSNNVMFQYDAFNKIKETYLVDYQIPKYGTPAQDLMYFIISSTKYELKLKQFDYFIKYYHDHLIENLKLLKYLKKLPSLTDIHIALFKYGVWGYATATGVMGAVLAEPSEHANLDNFLGDTDAGTNFKLLMYSNDVYRKHIEAILPWLYNRGALEI